MMRTVREPVRGNVVHQQLPFYIWSSVAALAFRLLLVLRFPGVVDDSRLYADIAKNWLEYGIYGITNSGVIMPTLSRLPGYPAFLAFIFFLFGTDNFRAAMMVQVLFDLGTCFLVADMARRLYSNRAAKAAFLLAAFCPFLANYAAAALTETLEIFFTALAFDLAFRGLGIGAPTRRPRIAWIGCGLSIGACILLRPDGGILLVAVGGYLLWLLLKQLRASPNLARSAPPPRTILLAAVLVALGALAPLIPWTLRNLHTLHRFEPLAPRYANDSDEVVTTGFNRWVKTWMADYVSVEEIYWSVPGSDMDFTRLPKRAFDSAQQKHETRELFAAYNRNHDMTPETDAGFAVLADQRIQASPLRYYVGLPIVRVVDMWLRPRTELFPSDPRWWEFNDEWSWLAVSLGFGVVNLVYVLLALAGLVRSREIFGIGLFVLFLALRSLFLGTLENPEPRYTLEFYPVLLVLASSCFMERE
jgi:4-amino-4-deoxy-L-arabinose transferase-like glycosyltransferase